MIINIMYICLLNCSSGQFGTFINNFKNSSLPFAIIASTFDIYQADEDVYVISEADFVKYLMMEGDTFINIKGLAPIGYHKYIAVGKFDVYDNLLGALYFRRINSEKGNISELMLCVFTKEGKLISTYPISGYYTAENIQFYSTIFSEENIEILFYRLKINDEFTSENVIEKKNLYITKDGLIQQRQNNI